jgi:hypothetical protein
MPISYSPRPSRTSPSSLKPSMHDRPSHCPSLCFCFALSGHLLGMPISLVLIEKIQGASVPFDQHMVKFQHVFISPGFIMSDQWFTVIILASVSRRRCTSCPISDSKPRRRHHPVPCQAEWAIQQPATTKRSRTSTTTEKDHGLSGDNINQQ